MINIIIDTNLLWKREILNSLSSRDDVLIWGTEVNYVETISQLDKGGDRNFRSAQSRLRTLLEITSGRILLNPIRDLCIKYGISEDRLLTRHLRNVAKTIILARNLDSCFTMKYITQEVCYKFDREQFNIIKEQNKQSKSSHIERLVMAIKKLHPEAVSNGIIDLSRVNIKSKRHIISTINSKKFRRDFFKHYLSNSINVDHIPIAIFREAKQLLGYYYKAYKGLLLLLYDKGANLDRSDLTDIELAVYISRPEWTLITEDKRLLSILTLGKIPNDKYAKPLDLINRIAEP